MDKLRERYEAIRASISNGVTLVAVSKFQSFEAIETLYRMGHRDFGENYVQELLTKSRELEARCPGIRWHFIGHLQTNKIKSLLPVVHAIHSVDSVRLAKEISKRAEGPIRCFLEVNLDREQTKSGFLPEHTPLAAEEIARLPKLDLRGLMAIPEPRESAESMRIPFAQLRQLEKSCRPATHGELSMGMSGDFEIAIREGATLVRIGTRLFGERKHK